MTTTHDIDCRKHPTVTPAWYITNSKGGTYLGPFTGHVELGDYLTHLTDELAPEERVEWVPARPTCAAGHALIVTSTGTFYNTVDGSGRVVRSIVMADAGSAGHLDPHPHNLYSCVENDCHAIVTDECAELAIAAVDEGNWSLLHTPDGPGGSAYIAMEG